MIPLRGPKDGEPGDLFDIEGYTTELMVPKDNPHNGKTLAELDSGADELDFVIVDLIRGDKRFPGTLVDKELRAGDVLKIEAGAEDLDKVISRFGFEPAHPGGTADTSAAQTDLSLMEVVVKPDARIDGREVGRLRLFRRRSVALLAVSRHGQGFRGWLKNFRLRAGDVLLLYGPAEQLPSAPGALPSGQRRSKMLLVSSAETAGHSPTPVGSVQPHISTPAAPNSPMHWRWSQNPPTGAQRASWARAEQASRCEGHQSEPPLGSKANARTRHCACSSQSVRTVRCSGVPAASVRLSSRPRPSWT